MQIYAEDLIGKSKSFDEKIESNDEDCYDSKYGNNGENASELLPKSIIWFFLHSAFDSQIYQISI